MIAKIKKRKNFLLVSRNGKYKKCSNLIVQYYKRENDESCKKNIVRFGITATKKIGNSVKRNRSKRRLREIIRELLPIYSAPGFDYVFISKKTLYEEKYAHLKREVAETLKLIINKVKEKK